ncbi:MAG: RNA polymerase sigma factor [Candidatus Limnocylindrales bacterium]
MELARTVPLEIDLDAELVAAYPMLARRLTVILSDSDEGQDVAQAAFARALERRSRFRGGDVRAWLYTIGIRLALNELRRRRRLVALSDATEPVWAMTSEPDLWIALAHLEPRQRAALVLATLDGYTHAEIGSILGVREGTVSSWISRSKDHLRLVLGDDR